MVLDFISVLSNLPWSNLKFIHFDPEHFETQEPPASNSTSLFSIKFPKLKKNSSNFPTFHSNGFLCYQFNGKKNFLRVSNSIDFTKLLIQISSSIDSVNLNKSPHYMNFNDILDPFLKTIRLIIILFNFFLNMSWSFFSSFSPIFHSFRFEEWKVK